MRYFTRGKPSKWKARYGGLTVSELRRLKDLEAENAEPKRLLPTRCWTMLVSRGFWQKTRNAAARRDAVVTLRAEHQFTERRACRLVARSSLSYQARPDRQARLREGLITLSGKHRRSSIGGMVIACCMPSWYAKASKTSA